MTVEEQEAYRRFESGTKPSFSHFLDDTITAGYGNLEWCGSWEFPLVVNQETLKVIPREYLTLQ